MLLPLGVALDIVLIDAGIALIAMFVGFSSAAWYIKHSAALSGQSAMKAGSEGESKANDAARSEMAALQMRDLAKSMASDVGDHCTLVTGISNELGAVDINSPKANEVVSGAVTKILTANEKLQTRLAEAEQKIQTQAEEIKTQQVEARTDALTQIANRRAFDDSLDKNLELLSRKNVPFSLLIMDVDFFKKFNDEHGHQAGDEVLRSVGRTLRKVVKNGDVACRYGGEEFALVMPNTSVVDARIAAERIRKSIESTIVRFEGKKLSVTVSVGMAEADVSEDESKLIGRADAGVYFSKEAGRNCGHWHDGEGLVPMDEASAPQEKPIEAPESSSQSAPKKAANDSIDTLPDRSTFTHELQRRVAECHRFGVTLASMHLVVRDYEALEKEFGTAVGELLLNSVARFIRASLRNMDLLASYDSGEFAVMLPGSSGREGRVIAARIQTAIASCAIPLGDKEIQLQLDIGVSGIEPGDDAEQMIDRARAEAFHAAKQALPIA